VCVSVCVCLCVCVCVCVLFYICLVSSHTRTHSKIDISHVRTGPDRYLCIILVPLDIYVLYSISGVSGFALG